MPISEEARSNALERLAAMREEHEPEAPAPQPLLAPPPPGHSAPPADGRLDLGTSRWIWLPVERTLPGTVALFRREFELGEVPKSAPGVIFADSRYRLWANGQRVQWGPTPFDPRHGEADPVELAPFLKVGRNVIGVEVLYYGQGDGTWPMGKPGLIARFDLGADRIGTDHDWRCAIDRGHLAGRAKRSFLRALQEQFDSRLHPHGWNHAGFSEGREWRASHELSIPATKMPFSGWHASYQDDFYTPTETETEIHLRTVPPMKEDFVEAKLIETGSVDWHGDPNDWFDFRLKGMMSVQPNRFAAGTSARFDGALGSRYWTYALPHEHVGWPLFEVRAEEGTALELIVQESLDPDQPWLDTHHFAWSRHTCKGGWEKVEPFEYEAFKFLQIHCRDVGTGVEIKDVRIRRRRMSYPAEAQLKTDDMALQSVFEAGIRTLENSAQDLVVDGMGRERQQYSGDGGHQLHAVRSFFGGRDVSAKFLRTFGYGQLYSGVWLDSWPGVDRLARLSQRELGASGWGPLIDHSIGFVLDHYHHWMQTGDERPVRENWERIGNFLRFLQNHATDGALPADGYGIEAVWLDHEAYRNQSEKKLALNLYWFHMLRRTAHMGKQLSLPYEWIEEDAIRVRSRMAERIVGVGLVNNPDEVRQGQEPRYDDRALATFLLDAEELGGHAKDVLDLLVQMPENVGRSYPANAVWRYWALARHGRTDVVLQELRDRWATMHSVRTAGTIQEFWKVTPGTAELMSHCAQAPLILAHQGILGLTPLTPGYATYELRPQLSGLTFFETTAALPGGAIHFRAEVEGETTRIRVIAPRYLIGTIVISDGEHPLAPGTASDFTILTK